MKEYTLNSTIQNIINNANVQDIITWVKVHGPLYEGVRDIIGEVSSLSKKAEGETIFPCETKAYQSFPEWENDQAFSYDWQIAAAIEDKAVALFPDSSDAIFVMAWAYMAQRIFDLTVVNAVRTGIDKIQSQWGGILYS